MKKLNITFLLTMLISMVGVLTLTTLISCGDDTVPIGSTTPVNGATIEQNEGTEAGHKYIDLGLSVKWATCNVGADYAWDYGSYFETSDDEKYDSKEYYNNDNKYVTYPSYKRLELNDDIAHQNWSGAWRTPTHEEWSELMNNCFWCWTTNYNNMGVAGYIVFKAKANADRGIVQCRGDYSETPQASYNVNSDAHIFLPAAGSLEAYEEIPVGKSGLYQASNLYMGSVFGSLIFFDDIVDYRWAPRGKMSIRPVSPNKNKTSIIRNAGNGRQRSTNGHQFIDLGTSNRWAICNIGASQAYEFGNYFAWGETVQKSVYDWKNYKFISNVTMVSENEYAYTISKYILKKGNYDWGWTAITVDNKHILEYVDDAARQNWGGAWRMPKMNDLTELYEMCYWDWTDNYDGSGVRGFIIYKAKTEEDKGIYHGLSKNWWYGTPTASYNIHNDAHIFLPSAGRYQPIYQYELGKYEYGYNKREGCCDYWASTLYGESFGLAGANSLEAKKDYPDIEGRERFYGMPIRAVCPF